MEDYFIFDENQPEFYKKFLVVVIYDITDDKRRNKMSKTLKAFGFRVQRSSFECVLTGSEYNKLVKKVERIITGDDLLRIYKLAGNTQVKTWGRIGMTEDEEVIII